MTQLIRLLIKKLLAWRTFLSVYS